MLNKLIHLSTFSWNRTWAGFTPTGELCSVSLKPVRHPNSTPSFCFLLHLLDLMLLVFRTVKYNLLVLVTNSAVVCYNSPRELQTVHFDLQMSWFFLYSFNANCTMLCHAVTYIILALLGITFKFCQNNLRDNFTAKLASMPRCHTVDNSTHSFLLWPSEMWIFPVSRWAFIQILKGTYNGY